QPKPPLLHQLLGSHYPVTNANPAFDSTFLIANSSTFTLPGTRSGVENASIYSLDDDPQRRLSVLNAMRPSRLIGHYKHLCHWYDFYVSEDSKNRSKPVRNYYKEQNRLIERFQEIDNFLDAGRIHYNMLSNYGDLRSKLATHTEEDEELESSPKAYGAADLANGPSVDSTNSKYSRFHDVPGNVDHEGAQFLGYNAEESSHAVYVAIIVNFFVNFVLLVGKIVVSLLTRSMSVVASLVDSVLDFLSTFIIYIANKLSTDKDWKVQHSYPVGRSRLEPLGVLVFLVIIIISFFQVGQESFKALFLTKPEDRTAVKIGPAAIAIMLLTILSKFACFVWCAKSSSSSVQALALDALTDIVFNTVSLLMPTVGYLLDIWWLDPLGAFLLLIYVIVIWCKTAYEHIDNLTGAVASQEDYKIILYLAYRFAESIKQITSLKVYHVGDNVNVEIDVVFAVDEFNLTLKDCHDIAEALQYSVESLPMVERAFVHIDYMEGNYKGHLK
ncbi:cation efflux family protein, partial [Suhomyces tanzawaensis NRRL Y-17324]